MTHLNPTDASASPVSGSSPDMLIRSSLLVLKLLVSIPVGMARGMAALSAAIGTAAGMAYADPFLPGRKGRK